MVIYDWSARVHNADCAFELANCSLQFASERPAQWQFSADCCPGRHEDEMGRGGELVAGDGPARADKEEALSVEQTGRVARGREEGIEPLRSS